MYSNRKQVNNVQPIQSNIIKKNEKTKNQKLLIFILLAFGIGGVIVLIRIGIRYFTG